MTYCCNVNIWLANQGKPTLVIAPEAADGIRNVHYKLVRNYTKNYDAPTNSCVDTQTGELYEIDERVPLPKIDLPDDNLSTAGPSCQTIPLG